jgi:AcrR family transcriptional regulator
MTSQAVWGQGSPPVEDIVAAALRLLDEQGFAALTTRRLASVMNIHQPTIYRRVADRDSLLGLVADAIMAEGGRLDRDALDWRDWLHATGMRVRAAWRRHPNAGPLLHYGGAHPAISRFLDDVVAVMRSAGLEGTELIGALQAYLGYVLGSVMLDGRGTHGAAPVPVEGSTFPDLQHLQLLVLQATETPEVVFETGLVLVLDGIAERARV